MSDELVIRAARPEHASCLAPLVRSSAPRAFDWVFARGPAGEATPFLAACHRHQHGLLGWANHFVGEIAGEVVASVALWSGARALLNDAAMVPRILAYYGLGLRGRGAASVIVRSLEVEAMLQRPRRDELYLGHLAVTPALRGRGLGRQLLDFARTEAEGQGHRRLLLDVADDNPEARRLYARVGYVAGRHREFPGPRDAVPGTTQMALEL